MSELGDSSANPHCMIWERALLWPVLMEKEREYYAILEYNVLGILWKTLYLKS